MAKRPLPTPEELRQLVRYEPETGKFYWLPREADTQPKRTWNTRYAGKKADRPNGHGYCRIGIFNRDSMAHRVAWCLFYGEWPEKMIDHINGDPTDNRIDNLRLTTPSDNQKNAKRPKSNTSGHCGVGWHKQRRKWRAYVQTNGKHISLGFYDEKSDAVTAAQAKREELGFSERYKT
ncbi:hypothetical protein CDQ92_13080 [Sphingopyxis bauzanensis]|uniref:HNH nuclease domain-containing protein n=1 Tax=Sphingopyxis bauzanensis TaxID=651663 RepID=A0A246JS01_9SPHN|nr:HNH endonuclease signature motif containing protein [Sphingopyxis bauzanensis]OWQ95713.1 hypothetical protein CDQ92_13080 [Sphingopyxis bauzanensis]GGJ39403.1 hypothetical protein GCM10011393_07000 [Sphingopyxis bauzanensis]